MEIHNHNLNIHYSSPKDIWDKLAELYSEMPEWSGFIHEIPQWYGKKMIKE